LGSTVSPASHAANRGRRGLLPFLGLASAGSVATLYYNQPLLLEISRTFHVSPGAVGAIPVCTQLGYASGIFLFVPLGDVVERRGLMLRLFGAISLILAIAGLSPSFWILALASVAIGMTAAVTHIIIPLAPELASPGGEGRAIGTVMTGLLFGVLLSRTISGAIGQMWGWRSVFLLAAVATAAFVPVFAWRVPAFPATRRLRYGHALRSLLELARREPALREASIIGFLVFGSFIAFWTNLAFFLGSPHYHLGAHAAGGFGVLGAAGALMAAPAGRLADRRGPRVALGLGLALMTAGWGLLWAFGYHLAGIIAGVIVLDMGTQITQVSNQTCIFAISREARSRINTVYMIVYFLGGATGSALSTFAWTHWQWTGVCGWGVLTLALAWLRYYFAKTRISGPALA
jgi:predicted MFS family arabinose efflux permease